MSQHFLKLRANITLPGDVALAERELLFCYETVQPLEDESALSEQWGIEVGRLRSHSRPHAFAGFVGKGPKLTLDKICRRLACVQEIWLRAEDVDLPKSAFWKVVESGGSFACVLPWMAAGELWGLSKDHEPNPSGLRGLSADLAGSASCSKLTGRLSSAPHLHGLHRYKARFFPRLARMLLQGVEGDVLDPFVGSGTTLLEASLLGQRSTGVDIDPLSCRIAQAKLDLMSMLPESFERGVGQLGEPGGGHYVLPPWMAIKFERKGNLEEKEHHEATIAGWIEALERVEDPLVKRVLSVCVSDGINRKFNVRMMGTGVGRFALEVRKTGLNQFIRKSVQNAQHQLRIFSELKKAYGVSPVPSRVVEGDASNLPLDSNSQDFILTSPPYLPAASGREAYLFSKSIALTALGLMTVEQMENSRRRVMGSMRANPDPFHSLPHGVLDLVDWLEKDELRSIKAQPTLAYYQDLQSALAESFRVLRPGAKACWVVGKESVFYTFKTRQVLRRVPCDLLFVQLAEGVGFEVVECLDIELQKKNLNARPRSKDPYFESAIILRKPRDGDTF